MGSAQVQGDIWGARAKDWAELQEPAWREVFDMGLGHAGLTPGMKLLEIGCGAGGALVAASELGAEVSGIDASENLVAIARERLPHARIEIGDMEDLPFGNDSFDLVVGINSFQFAEDIGQALSEARRVCRSGGAVFILVWGRREDCELISITASAVFALLPPPPSGASAPIWPGDDGVAEGYLRKAGLEQIESGDFPARLAFPDQATAVRAVMSASARAIRAVGEERVAGAIRETLPGVTLPDGSVAWNNQFHWAKASKATN